MQIKHIVPKLSKENVEKLEKILKNGKVNVFVYLCMGLFAFTYIMGVLLLYKVLG